MNFRGVVLFVFVAVVLAIVSRPDWFSVSVEASKTKKTGIPTQASQN